jgi:hypothetical protein
MPNPSAGGEQQLKDSPPKIIPNNPATSMNQALANSKAQVDKAK